MIGYIILVLVVLWFATTHTVSGWALFCVVVVLVSLPKLTKRNRAQKLVIRGNNNQVTQTNQRITRRIKSQSNNPQK